MPPSAHAIVNLPLRIAWAGRLRLQLSKLIQISVRNPMISTFRQTAVALAAGASLMLAAAQAQAVVVTTNLGAGTVIPFNIDGLYFNVVTGASGPAGASVPGWDFNPFFQNTTTPPAAWNFFSSAFSDVNRGMVGFVTTASNLTPGSSIGLASTFVTGLSSAGSAVVGINYYGFRFTNESTSAINYGYAMFSLSAVPPVLGSLRLLGYAYEDTGLSLTVTPIPEPSTALMMLGGLLAAGALRKRLVARDTATA